MKIINTLIYIIGVIIFFKILDYSNKENAPKLIRNVCRIIIVFLFIIAIATLVSFAIIVKEVGAIKRIIAALLALLLLIYLLHTIKKYIKGK